MSGSDGISRLRKAVDNQASLGEAAFMLPIGEMLAILDECGDELAQLAWAKNVHAPKDADGEAVPLDATELYTDEGVMIFVGDIRFDGYWWYVWGHLRGSGNDMLYPLDKLHCTERDSWALLEKDVLTLVTSDRLADPEGDVKECICRAKALAEAN